MFNVDINKIIGNNVRNIRLDKNLTLKEFSLSINISVSELSRIENGLVSASAVFLYKLYKYHGVNINKLFDVPPDWPPDII